MLVLADGRLVFHRSMVHFSPAHAGALALYDPVSDREAPLYPPPGVRNERGGEKVPGTDLWMDRSITDVKNGKVTGTIEFMATEQRIRLNERNGGDPEGPERRLRVICNVAGVRPVCTGQQVRELGAASTKVLRGASWEQRRQQIVVRELTENRSVEVPHFHHVGA